MRNKNVARLQRSFPDVIPPSDILDTIRIIFPPQKILSTQLRYLYHVSLERNRLFNLQKARRVSMGNLRAHSEKCRLSWPPPNHAREDFYGSAFPEMMYNNGLGNVKHF